MKVGELVAELTLDTSGMSKGVDKAGKEAKRLSDDLASINKGGLVAAGALTAIGVAAMEAANRAADYADQIKEVATVTGMTTDQVQRWKYAADQSGVSFDALTVTMRMLTQNIQNVDDKNSSLKASLDSLGVSAKTANGQFKDTNTLMLETLTALKNMDDPVRRNTIAMQLYGRSWSELADFMEKDVNLAQLMAKANPIDAYKLNQAEQYKNKMNALAASFDEASIKLGTKFIPTLSYFASYVNKYVIPEISKMIDITTKGFDQMVYAGLGAMDALNRAMGYRFTNGQNISMVQQYAQAQIAENIARNNEISAAMGGNWTPEGPKGEGAEFVKRLSQWAVMRDASDGSGSGSGPGGSGGSGFTPNAYAKQVVEMYKAGKVTKADIENAYWNMKTLSPQEYNEIRIGIQGVAVKNPYDGGTTPGRTFTDSGIDISGSAAQGSFIADPAMTANPLAGWNQADVSAVQSAIKTIWEPPAGGYKNYYTGEVSETLPAGVPPVSEWPVSELSPGLVVKNYAGWMAGGYVINKAVQDAAKQSIRDVFAKGGYGDAEGFINTINTGSKTSALSWGLGFKAPAVEAPTVTDYGATQVSYTSSGAIKSNYSMGITQGSNGVLTVNLLLDGKVVAQSVVENLASLGVRV